MIVNVKRDVSNKTYSREEIERLLSNIESELLDTWSYMDALSEEGIETIPQPFNSKIGAGLARAEGILKAANARTTYEQYGLRFWRFK